LPKFQIEQRQFVHTTNAMLTAVPARVKVLVASFMQPTAEYGYRPNAPG
jgi:hypothetical protein